MLGPPVPPPFVASGVRVAVPSSALVRGDDGGGRDARWSPRHGFDRGGDGDEGRSDSNQGGSNYSALKPISGEMWARANTANVGSHAGPSPLFM